VVALKVSRLKAVCRSLCAVVFYVVIFRRNTMKYKFKSLAVAVALSAVAMSAQAEIDTATGTNSELFFSAWNGTNGYTFDLASALTLNDIVGPGEGVLAADLVSGLPTFAAGTVLFDGVLTGFGSSFASTDGVQWNLAAFDNTGLKRFISTQDVSTSGSIATTNLRVSQTAAAMESYVGAVNTKMVDLTTGVDSYAPTLSTDGTAFAGTWGQSWNNNLTDSTNAMGATSALGFYARASSSSGAGNRAPIFATLGLTARTYQAGGEWRLELASPAVAAIPEPESYAMMLAGLALMGGVARRRNNKA